ncbi:MAG: hypothetical protein ACRDIV_17725 [Ktedonobacteraceae bacterium]
MKTGLHGTLKQRQALRTGGIGVGFFLLHVDGDTVLELEVYADRQGVLRRVDDGEPLLPITIRNALPGCEISTLKLAPQLAQATLPEQLEERRSEGKEYLPVSTDMTPLVRTGLAALDRSEQLLQSLAPLVQDLLIHGTRAPGQARALDVAENMVAVLIQQLYRIDEGLAERANLDILAEVEAQVSLERK